MRSFFNLQRKSGFSSEKKYYIYAIYLNLSSLLSLSTCMQWRSVRGEVKPPPTLRTLSNLHKILLENFPN